jgi:hypothetical protein
MPTYDLLVYHDFKDNLNSELANGDDAGEKLGETFEGLRVAAVGPSIHDSKAATVVLAHTRGGMPDVQAFLNQRA